KPIFPAGVWGGKAKGVKTCLESISEWRLFLGKPFGNGVRVNILNRFRVLLLLAGFTHHFLITRFSVPEVIVVSFSVASNFLFSVRKLSMALTSMAVQRRQSVC